MAEGSGRFDEPGFRVPVTEFTDTWYPDVDTALRTVQESFRRRRRRASWYEVGRRGKRRSEGACEEAQSRDKRGAAKRTGASGPFSTYRGNHADRTGRGFREEREEIYSIMVTVLVTGM